VTFSTVEMVTVVINGGLVVSTSYHRRRSAGWSRRGGMYPQMWKIGGRFEVINR
jgi:hypothetical protein